MKKTNLSLNWIFLIILFIASSCIDETLELREGETRHDDLEEVIPDSDAESDTTINYNYSAQYLIEYDAGTLEQTKEQIRISFINDPDVQLVNVSECPAFIDKELWYINPPTPCNGGTNCIGPDPDPKIKIQSTPHVSRAIESGGCKD